MNQRRDIGWCSLYGMRKRRGWIDILDEYYYCIEIGTLTVGTKMDVLMLFLVHVTLQYSTIHYTALEIHIKTWTDVLNLKHQILHTS